MKPIDYSRLLIELETRVRARTGRRVKDLDIELSQEGVTVRGKTLSFYDKQLATHSVREMMPEIRLNNAIVVA